MVQLASQIKQLQEGWAPVARGSRKVEVYVSTNEDKGARTFYMRELCYERLAKKSKHLVSSASMKWGHTEEQKAQDAYEVLTGHIVVPSEFIVHPKYDWLGCSPGPSGLLRRRQGHVLLQNTPRLITPPHQNQIGTAIIESAFQNITAPINSALWMARLNRPTG